MSRRLLALPLAVLGLLLAAPSAFAAGPSAIGVGSDGTSYVGYPLTGGIQRIAVDGSTTSLPAWGTPGAGAGQLGGIVAISVAAGADGHVWVLDTNLRVQEFTKGGQFVRGTQLSACDAGVVPDATRFGGIDVRVDGTSTTPVAVYVAHPCANQVLKIDPDPAATSLVTTATTPTASRPGRVSVPRYLTGPASMMNVWVALPGASQESGSATAFTPRDLAPVSGSTRTYDYSPSDLYVDEHGQMFVSEARYDIVRIYRPDGAQDRYRGGTGSGAALFDNPQAFDVAGQENNDTKGNIFVADSGNSRVQRLDQYTYWYWEAAATGTDGGPVVVAPTNTAAPFITGTAQVGQTLTCRPGTWTGNPEFAYRWDRDGTEIAVGVTYTPTASDVGRSVTCRVIATNGGGTGSASSGPVTPVAAAAQVPVVVTQPRVTGDANPGGTLTCDNGTWNNAPTTYSKRWVSEGVLRGTGDTYAVQPADVGRLLICEVTATNAAGSATVDGPRTQPSWRTPASTGAPQIQGSPGVGQAATCTPGSWAWAPQSYAYSWRRDGAEVATGQSYTFAAADAGRQITCVVTATNPAGSATSISAAVSPPTPPVQTPAPQNTERPGIQGTTVVGNTLTCTPGGWTGSPTSYAYSWRRDGAAIAGATGATYALVAADAGRTITCTSTATNAGGATTAVSDGVVVTAAPSTPSTRVGVTINNGAEATNTAAVTLRIREPAGATAVLISNDGSFDTPTQLPVAANDTYSWTLDARGSQKRARVVYVRFVGVLLDANQTFQDDILLDTSAPTVTTATISARSSAKSATVRVAATDSGSGVQQIQYSGTKSTKKAKTLKLKKSRSFKVKPKNAKWVRAVDVAGNASKWKRIAYKAPKKGKR